MNQKDSNVRNSFYKKEIKENAGLLDHGPPINSSRSISKDDIDNKSEMVKICPSPGKVLIMK